MGGPKKKKKNEKEISKKFTVRKKTEREKRRKKKNNTHTHTHTFTNVQKSKIYTHTFSTSTIRQATSAIFSVETTSSSETICTTHCRYGALRLFSIKEDPSDCGSLDKQHDEIPPSIDECVDTRLLERSSAAAAVVVEGLTSMPCSCCSLGDNGVMVYM